LRVDDLSTWRSTGSARPGCRHPDSRCPRWPGPLAVTGRLPTSGGHRLPIWCRSCNRSESHESAPDRAISAATRASPWTAVTRRNPAVRHRAVRHGRPWAGSADRRHASASFGSRPICDQRHLPGGSNQLNRILHHAPLSGSIYDPRQPGKPRLEHVPHRPQSLRSWRRELVRDLRTREITRTGGRLLPGIARRHRPQSVIWKAATSGVPPAPDRRLFVCCSGRRITADAYICPGSEEPS
jgi:hypothetical protein